MIAIGTVVSGKYRLVRLLGDGGMGSVYEAQHAMLGTRVAVKMLHPALGRRTGLVERFLQEARVAAQIRSPHVVQVTDVDRTLEGNAYIVMELLEGEPLSGVLDRQRKLAVPVACEYATQILEALEAAHSIGVVHRDLKPENVFVTFSGGRPVLKLIDFGIAKALRIDVPAKKLTVAGVVMGTAEYMAPEQAHSADKVDGRSDIYAVGVMLYEMIAGARPVGGDDARDIAWKVERGEVMPLVQAAPDTPREIAGLVHRAMAARPELRFSSAVEMRLALQSAREGKRSPAGLAGVRAPAGRTVELAPAAVPSSPGLTKAASSAGLTGPDPDADKMRSPPVATAIAVPAHAQAGGAPAGAIAPHGPPRRRSATVMLVTVPLILGAGVVALLVGTGTCASSSPTPPAEVAQPAVVEAAAATTPPVEATASTSPDVPALSPTRAAAGGAERVAVSGRPSGPPAATGDRPSPGSVGPSPIFPAVTPALPASLPSVLPSALPLPAGFPTAIPSGFPAELPSAFPSALPAVLPSVLPTWPPPPPPPASSSSARSDERTY